MNRKVKIGSMLYINRQDSPDMIREWVQMMADAKLKLLRLFVGWDLVEPRKSEWSWELFDAAFDEAQIQQMDVVPTLHHESPPGWMKVTKNAQDRFDLENEEYVEAAYIYVTQVVQRYRNHPALDSWIAWNEACLHVPYVESIVPAFQEYAQEYYGDIKAFNKVHYPQFDFFEDIELRHLTSVQGGPVPSLIEKIDWQRFCVHYLMKKLGSVIEVIRQADPDHPVHVNPHLLGQCMFPIGQSIWKESRITDFAGFSAHPVWHSTRYGEDDIEESISLFSALARSASCDPTRKFWASELQGGPAVFSGVRRGCPSPDEIDAWLSTIVNEGGNGIIFWCFNNRNGGIEAGEWALMNQSNQPSSRLRQVTDFINDLELSEEGEMNPKVEPEVAILYSEDNLILHYVSGSGSDEKSNPRNKESGADAICGAYRLFYNLGISADFVDEIKLTDSDFMKRYRLLVIPGNTVFSRMTAQAVEVFVKNGATVIADGMLGWKDANGQVIRESSEVERIFGARLNDIIPFAGRDSLYLQNGISIKTIDAWFVQVLLDISHSNTKIEGRWENGACGLTQLEHPSGGKAIWIGTSFFQSVFAFGVDKGVENWFAKWLLRESIQTEYH
ncbi:MAG: beta-galactosidase [Verrucomicrobiota bacterium]